MRCSTGCKKNSFKTVYLGTNLIKIGILLLYVDLKKEIQYYVHIKYLSKFTNLPFISNKYCYNLLTDLDTNWHLISTFIHTSKDTNQI